MSKRTASWLAWSMCALSLALTVLSLFLLTLNLSYPGVHIFDYWLLNVLLTIGFSAVGALIVSRSSPSNLMGWLFCAIGLLWGVAHLDAQYTIYALLAVPGSLPAGEAAAWLYTWLWAPPIILTVLLFLLFPNGQLPSSRWRWFAWLSVLFISIGALVGAFSPGPIGVGIGPIHNPLGMANVPRGFQAQTQPLYWSFTLIAAASLIVRMRRAREVERQQIKWFAYATTVLGSSVILTYTVSEAIGARWLEWISFTVMTVSALGIPIAMGVAILRYRLYNIDLIINRTLVYSLLTATLALLYFGSVTALQYLFSLLTGQGNTLAIVVSTLAIAALVGRLSIRIQSFIDRRFYRRKYDARKTLEAFGSKLRDETDLEKLCEDLAEVVDETMQPAHLSVILRSEVPSTTTTKEQGQQEDQQAARHEED